jgi:hypothetical protein
MALDPQRLWLPVRYQDLHPSLVKAAETAEALDRCVTVMEATVDLEQSRPEHPIYRILCRQENGRTYSEMVDGLSFATLTTIKVVEPELTPEEQALLLRQEEERREAEIAQHKIDAWTACRQSLVESTRLMMELQWLTDLDDGAVEPVEFNEALVRFVLDFDARGVLGEALHYRAECSYSENLAKVVVKRR